MSGSHQRFLLWLSIFGLFLGLIGFIGLARFVPPPPPNLSAAEVAQIYLTDTNLKRFGFVLSMVGFGLFFGMPAVISAQMNRIPGISKSLVYTQIATGAVNTFILIMPAVIFTAISFRPERNIDATAALHDLGWIFGTMPESMYMLQQIVVAMAIFSDKSKDPVFPRWLAYVSLWTMTIYITTNVIPFVRSGPFAWNGLISFWVVLIAGSIWAACMYPVMFKNTRRMEYA